MDGFSSASLTSLCTSISHRAIACVGEVKSLVATVSSDEAHAVQLARLVSSLEEFISNVVDLETSLNSSTVISQRTQSELNRALVTCDGATAVLNKQLMRLHAENVADLDWTAFAIYNDLLLAHGELFAYFIEILLKPEREDQDASLDTAGAQTLLEQVKGISRLATDSRTSILPQEDSNRSSVPNPRLASTNGKGLNLEEDPPPYSPPEASSSSQPGPSSQQCSSSKGFSWSNTFKAFAAPFRAKPDPLVSALCEAVMLGDENQVAGLIAQGANVNGRNDKGKTPLQSAIKVDQASTARILLEAGADWRSSAWSEIPPFFLAASVGSVQIAQMLYDLGAKVGESSMSGQPYFIDVVAANNMKGIRFMLEHGASASTVNLSGRPVIAQAVKHGNKPLVELLLNHGADPNVCDLTGKSVLAIACEKDSLDLAEFLLQRGAKATARNMSGVPVLSDTLAKRRWEFARRLLDRGADANSRDINGQSVLLNVICDSQSRLEEKISMARILLEHGASANTSDMLGRPLLSHAMELGNAELIALLLRHGAKTKISMKGGETLLTHAVENGAKDQVKLLLEHGADVNAKDKKGRTPLLIALVKSDDEVVQLLKQHGADVHLAGAVTPMELAAAIGAACAATGHKNGGAGPSTCSKGGRRC
ncbi:hypothetical protein S40285_07255 [Stachybotrys chlorohalonatus IBT 40285]|uniref:Uncharacterized protein n=1 Tax=Stachybotrys chlorohalonatus (strain IBT 40285) TaxID=1283841 RepID=A0A084QSV9_STAC4|nr:hypothetical protein S40285_07255 [Stachybotrys chlorohalonata IBT 40285]